MAIDVKDELARLGQALGSELAPDWGDRLDRLAPLLQDYLEYQVALDDGGLALITLGREESWLDQVDTLLQEAGVAAPALAIFRSMRRYAGAATWGLKSALGPQPELQLYIKKPLPVPEVLFWLERQGVAAEAGRKIQAIAATLDKSHTHFVGADFPSGPGGAVAYQLYFTQYLDEASGVAGRLEQVLAELGLASAAGLFLRYHPLLAQPQETLWVSVSLVEGAILPALKLDYANVRRGLLATVLEDLGYPDSAYRYLQTIGNTLGVDRTNYVGLRFKAEARPSLTVYLTRSR